MPFIKYPEIENSYHNKHIKKHIEHHPSVQKAMFYTQLKYDGSNIQFIFEPHTPMQLASRKRLLEEGENFNGVLDILEDYRELIDWFQEYCDEYNKNVNLYGEIYGPGIQNRINYGNEKEIGFFDVRINGELLSLEQVLDIPYILGYYLPFYEEYIPFDKIQDVSVPEEHEGVVIKQYNKVDNSLLFLKKKNEKFNEKSKEKKNKNKKQTDPIVNEYINYFLPYITENRVLSVFSKEGEIDSPDQIGYYIKMVNEDAIKDFEKDYDCSNLTKNQRKQIFKSGNKEIVSILEKYL